LEHSRRGPKGIERLDWTDEPKRQRSFFYVEHDLDVATFFMALRLACDRLGHRIHLAWHFDRECYKVRPPAENRGFLSDRYFLVERSDRKRPAHVPELDRGSAGLTDMCEKFERYFRW